MTGLKKILVGIAVLVASLCSVCGVVYVRWTAIDSDVPVFAPSEWLWLDGSVELMSFPNEKGLLIRRARQASDASVNTYERVERNGAFYRKRARSEVPLPSGIAEVGDLETSYVYEYVPATKELKCVASGRWDTANGLITSCDHRWPPPFIPVLPQVASAIDFVTQLERTAYAGDKQIWHMLSAAAEVCLRNHYVSPPQQPFEYSEYASCVKALEETGYGHRTQVSLVSALFDLNSFTGSVGMWGGGSPFGSARQHYHQVLDLSKMNFIGNAKRIPFLSSLGKSTPVPGRDFLMGMGWSADNRYVVYVGLRSLCVVPVDAE